MTLVKKQAGMSLIGWLILILILGGAITIGLKLAPGYMDYYTMSRILDEMSTEQGMGDKANLEIQQIIARRFDMNNIRDFDEKKNITVDRTSNDVSIILDYENRYPLMGNVDLIASFHKQVDIKI